MPLDTPFLALFALLVGGALAIDLGLFGRSRHSPSTRAALAWTGIWIALALGFGVLLALARGGTTGVEYLTAYVIEYSLSVDNVFVFSLVFAAFAVPHEQRHRLLFWGVIGALVMRLAMILAGVALIERFDWILLVFGALLLVTALRIARAGHDAATPGDSLVVRLLRRRIPVVDGSQGAFLVRSRGKWAVTPLLLALVVIETSDLVFALDSIPAVFGVTTDPLVVYTSNAFAVLGLRSLAVVVSDATSRLRYLRLGLSGVLGFVGLKMLLGDLVHLPPLLSLGVVVGILAIATVASVPAARTGVPARLELRAPRLEGPGRP